MLEVVVPSKCNASGERYGFVRFSNVRDICKLLKAVNSVWFGNFQIKAKVARFDKAASAEVEKAIEEGGGVIVSKECAVKDGGGVKPVVGGALKQLEGVKLRRVGSTKDVDPYLGVGDFSKAAEMAKGGEGVSKEARQESVVGVKVGEVTLNLNKGVRRGFEGVKCTQEASFFPGSQPVVVGHPSIQKFIRKYSSHAEDLLWASQGVLANVINGEAIPIVQKRISDAGIEDVEIIPVGADRVFIRSLSEVNISTILNDAKDFFAHFFNNFKP